MASPQNQKYKQYHIIHCCNEEKVYSKTQKSNMAAVKNKKVEYCSSSSICAKTEISVPHKKCLNTVCFKIFTRFNKLLVRLK